MMAASVASHWACRSSSVNSSSRSTSSSGVAGGMLSGMASGPPAQEVGQDTDADLLALLDMELRAGAVAGGDEGDHLAAIVGGGDHLRRVGVDQRETVHEIHVVAG